MDGQYLKNTIVLDCFLIQTKTNHGFTSERKGLHAFCVQPGGLPYLDSVSLYYKTKNKIYTRRASCCHCGWLEPW